jgi:hypothetical protein
MDGFGIGDRIYWTLLYSSLLHFTFHYYTSVHSHVFTNRCLVAAFNGGRSLPLDSRTVPGLSYQQLSTVFTNCPAYNISARTAQKTVPLLLCPIVAVETHLFEKLLIRNGCCIFIYLAVVAQ